MSQQFRPLCLRLLRHLLTSLTHATNIIYSGLEDTILYIVRLILGSRNVLQELIAFAFPSHEGAVRSKRGVSIFKTAPRPLPKIRPRILTLPTEPSISITSEQSQSPFLYVLPLEIRQIIYYHALAGQHLHIIRLDSQLSHVRCRDPLHFRLWHHQCWGITVRDSDHYHAPHTGFMDEHGGFLPLLKCCRQIYTEAIDILYSQNSFSMLHLESIICLSSTVLPQRMNAIRSLEFGWLFYSPHPPYTRPSEIKFPPHDEGTWERVWDTLADMQGLRKLRVDLLGNWTTRLERDAERMLLLPAAKIWRPKVWEMRVNWLDTGADLEDAPFTIERCSSDL